jgi:phage/plasmid primase-like uncharacterized protein/energy-coupling factor transporter ATP-binding protein EcfA2
LAENQSLQDALARSKVGILPQFNAGILRDKAAWFVGREFTVDGLLVQLAWYGDWREEGQHFWRSHADKLLNSEQKKVVNKEIEAQLIEQAAAREEEWAIIALEAEELWKKGSEQGDHPYLGRKKLLGLLGARVWLQERGHPVLLVPMRDVDGKLWNLTRIYTKKFEGTGSDKFVLKGGRKQGVFHVLGEIRDESTIYLCEGFATAASVHEATGRSPTIVCFDAGNLLPVAEALRARYPGAKFIFAADNDQRSKDRQGRLYNPGKEKSLKAASTTRGAVVLPRFTDKQLLEMGEKGPTDWNDLHVLAGIAEVTDQLTNPNKQVQEVVPLMPRGKGKNAKISEKDVCETLLQYFDERVLAFEEDLFIYRDNYWQHMGFAEMSKLKRLIAKLAPEYGINDIERALRYFTAHAPNPPPSVNLFQPTPFAANFTNGTLHVYREGQGYRTEFRPHSQNDYLTSRLPFPFPGTPGTPEYHRETNAEFDSMLARVWEGDEDLADKVRIYKQLLGACLIPLFPIIVLATGRPGSGKSTLLKIMRRLVSEENISTVDPSDFHGFLMEGMIGKLLNINTDIDLSTPMKDSMVKKIIDRIPVQVNRKNQRVVNAFLPAVHAYAGNGLPKTLDGESRAYERRMVILKTEKFTATGNYDREFDQWVWEQGPGGIICAAIEGLFDLLSSGGHYHQVESGRQLVRKMQDRNDPVSNFLVQVEQGHVADESTTVKIGPGQQMERARVWRAFCAWREQEDRPTRELGRTHFYEQMEERGYRIKAIRGTWFFEGIGTEETQGSNF